MRTPSSHPGSKTQAEKEDLEDGTTCLTPETWPCYPDHNGPPEPFTRRDTGLPEETLRSPNLKRTLRPSALPSRRPGYPEVRVVGSGGEGTHSVEVRGDTVRDEIRSRVAPGSSVSGLQDPGTRHPQYVARLPSLPTPRRAGTFLRPVTVPRGPWVQSRTALVPEDQRRAPSTFLSSSRVRPGPAAPPTQPASGASS